MSAETNIPASSLTFRFVAAEASKATRALVAIAQWLRTSRPLVAFDIEATGPNPQVDRLITLSALRVDSGMEPVDNLQRLTVTVNPGVPIPAEATAVHGISDADVAGLPTFDAVAGKVARFFSGADLLGYNLRKFDVPLLQLEFGLAGMTTDPLAGARLLDACAIFMQRERRDLAAALRFFCDAELDGAHEATADVDATVRVFAVQLLRYADLPHDLDALHTYCERRDPAWLDSQGKLAWRNGEAVINFGKHQGVPLRHFVEHDQGFLFWMLNRDFPKDTLAIVEGALQGEYPSAPPSAQPVEA